MASSQECSLCGARFDVPGAVGTLAQHMASFHPAKATKAQREKAAAAADDDSAGNDETSSGPQPDNSPTTDVPIDKLTKPQLIELAEAENVDLSGASTNAERIAAIEAHRAANS